MLFVYIVCGRWVGFGREKLAGKKMSKLDRYAEHRLWNNKLRNGRQISTAQLMEELKTYYRLSGTGEEFEERLQDIVRRARRRVHKKSCKMAKDIHAWSEKLDLPVSVVGRWVKKGMVNRQNIETVVFILEDYRRLMNGGEKINGAKQHCSRHTIPKGGRFCLRTWEVLNKNLGGFV